jgi:hypothetical protein
MTMCRCTLKPYKLIQEYTVFLSVFSGVEIGDNDILEEQIHAQLAKTEITLTLTNKFEVPEDDQTDIKTLLIRTKRMSVDVIACQDGETLAQILETPATEEQVRILSNLYTCI